MTRTLACISVGFWLGLAGAGTAAGQALGEAALGAGAGAAAASGAKGAGSSIGGVFGALDKTLKAGEPVSDAHSSAGAGGTAAAKGAGAKTARAKGASKRAPSSAAASPAPAPKWEDPGGVEPGLSYEELVRRFGPSAMVVTNSAERALSYPGKDGMFQVKVRDGVVTGIEKPQP
jgi:hypothetical protein